MFYRSLTVKSTGKTYRNGRARNACHCWCRIGIWTCFLRELDIGWRTGHRRSIEFPSGEVRANESLIPYRACGSRRRQRPCLLRRPIYARGTQRNGREKLKYHVEKKTKRVRYIATRWMCIYTCILGPGNIRFTANIPLSTPSANMHWQWLHKVLVAFGVQTWQALYYCIFKQRKFISVRNVVNNG